MTTRQQLDDWLAATEWVTGDVSVSNDAARSSPAQPKHCLIDGCKLPHCNHPKP